MNIFIQYILSSLNKYKTPTNTVTRLVHFSLLKILFVNHCTEIYLLAKDTVYRYEECNMIDQSLPLGM